MIRELLAYKSNYYIKLLNEKYVIYKEISIYQNEILRYIIEHFDKPEQLQIALVEDYGIDLKIDEKSYIYIFHEKFDNDECEDKHECIDLQTKILPGK